MKIEIGAKSIGLNSKISLIRYCKSSKVINQVKIAVLTWQNGVFRTIFGPRPINEHSVRSVALSFCENEADTKIPTREKLKLRKLSFLI